MPGNHVHTATKILNFPRFAFGPGAGNSFQWDFRHVYLIWKLFAMIAWSMLRTKNFMRLGHILFLGFQVLAKAARSPAIRTVSKSHRKLGALPAFAIFFAAIILSILREANLASHAPAFIVFKRDFRPHNLRRTRSMGDFRLRGRPSACWCPPMSGKGESVWPKLLKRLWLRAHPFQTN